MKTLGELFRIRRTRKALSLRQVAGRAGISYSYLSQIETGARGSKDLNARIEAHLLRVLEIDPQDPEYKEVKIAGQGVLRFDTHRKHKDLALEAGAALALHWQDLSPDQLKRIAEIAREGKPGKPRSAYDVAQEVFNRKGYGL